MIDVLTKQFTTDGSGDAAIDIGDKVNGRVFAIKYDPGDVAGTAILAFTGKTSGVAVLTKSAPGTSVVWFYPAASACLASDGSDANAAVPVHVFREAIHLVVSGGGDTKTGTVTLYVNQ